MPISKFTKYSSWEAIPRSTAQEIRNSDALALWVYLITQPPTWEPREMQIRGHFGWGYDKYRKAMGCLKDRGLANWEIIRSENGRITTKHLHIYAEANGRENQRQAQPTASKPDDLYKTETTEKTETEEKITTLSGRPDQTPKPKINGVEAKRILDHLNTTAGRSYRAVDSNTNLIKARLLEGYSEDDLKAIIDRKVRDWRDDDTMRQYLRPATLFNATKCAQYMGEVPTTPTITQTPKVRMLPDGMPDTPENRAAIGWTAR